MSEAATKVRVTIRGRVQGVGFRYSLQHVAEQHGVSGWCRNQRDGTVEAVFAGAAEAVDQVLAWCRQGPPMARIDEVQTQPADDEPIWPGFLIRG